MSKAWINTRTAATGGLLAALPTLILAQGALPQASQQPTAQSTQRDRAETLNVSPGNNLFESDTMLKGVDRIFDTDSDAIDFEEGTVQWKGRTFNMGDSRVMRARFERYLATPVQETDAANYLKLMKELQEELLVNNNDLNSEALRDVWQMLFEASTYDMDAGNSLIIANQVFNAWRIRDERRRDQLSRDELERLRKVQQEIVANRATFLQRAEERRVQRTLRETGGKSKGDKDKAGGDASVVEGGNLSESSFRGMDLAETETKIRALESYTANNAIQAKLQFQTQILEFLLQRRFQHVLVSASFYRLIFKGSAQNLEVGKKQLADFVGAMDVTHTVGTLEYIAREAISDIRTGMSAVENAYGRGERINALQRLQEAYFLGEHMPEVMLFDPESRTELHALYRDIRDARRLFDLKDYERVDSVANSIEERTSDFPSSQLISATSSVQRLSDLALLAAQQAIGLGQFDKAESSLSRATELWPLNPRIKSFTEEMSNRVDVSKLAATEFDRYHANGDYRQLYNSRSELGVALMSDPERSKKLSEAVNLVANIEILLSQARELVASGNPYAAWEYLENASQFDPKDVELNSAKVELAPRVAAFVGKLDAAERYEADGKLAASLTQFLAAQDIYSGSQISRLGIERISARLVESIQPEAQ